MEEILDCCAGIDVHKAVLVVCVRHRTANRAVTTSIKTFGAMTVDILAMSDWFASEGVTHVAMESTGVFWKPIFNLLEDRFRVLLCNAQHIKNVPGRKTDAKDCEWIAQLLQLGLLKGSFVPDRPLRDLRDLTRHRAKLVDEKTRIANRIQKVLEDANIKLASVASDVLGKSGRAMLQAMVDGTEDPAVLADLSRRRLRNKIPQLREALRGRVTDHHRYMLRTLLEHLVFLERSIDEISQRIEKVMAAEDARHAQEGSDALPFAEALLLLEEIPGVDRRTAQNVLAEIGTDMSQFPSGAHLASWTGLCPGNNRTAGKRKMERTAKGNRWLRRTLTLAAWGAGRTKGSYFMTQFKRLAGRRGTKRAIVAVAHTLLTLIHSMLTHRRHFTDLGANHFDQLHAAGLTRYFVRRLEQLGFAVELSSKKLPA